ncbi:hypothetical protein KIN20_031308 [Parelaphostrongylus tenuis]|uniref:Uncharacterized protein n=1 Tax=Parelaphostrongylus tenuis TaxID=148309 RepID=A0AAD5WGX7_PARTN|nr:hypothetical protein KIN20_031308 [Parelaphostrongylus tenuis]
MCFRSSEHGHWSLSRLQEHFSGLFAHSTKHPLLGKDTTDVVLAPREQDSTISTVSLSPPTTADAQRGVAELNGSLLACPKIEEGARQAELHVRVLKECAHPKSFVRTTFGLVAASTRFLSKACVHLVAIGANSRVMHHSIALQKSEGGWWSVQRKRRQCLCRWRTKPK